MSALKYIIIVAASLLTACAQQLPKRPHVSLGELAASNNCIGKVAAEATDRHTPERTSSYTLHFIEFDDHGWTYPKSNENGGDGAPAEVDVGTASQQLDCAIEHIAARLKKSKDSKIALYVYVHGWHHNASHDDYDVRQFRELLHTYGQATKDDREVIGIYVGWDGETVTIPLLKDLLTFQTRKNAAHRVADGRVRELFARIKGLRAHYNQGDQGLDCAEKRTTNDKCRLRSIMIGHSFGGLILHSAVQPYILETLAVQRDVPELAQSAALRSRGIADLIILLNPAFEASLYEPLHRAAMEANNELDLPPLLIAVTSMNDTAVGKYFPLARNVTTVMHYPALSNLQSEALRDTIGNVGRYVTHALCVTGTGGSCERAKTPFENPATGICDMQLRKLRPHDAKSGTAAAIVAATQNRLVWNVRTYGDIVKNHNDRMNPRLINFFEYMYARVVGIRLPCLPAE